MGISVSPAFKPVSALVVRVVAPLDVFVAYLKANIGFTNQSKPVRPQGGKRLDGIFNQELEQGEETEVTFVPGKPEEK